MTHFWPLWALYSCYLIVSLPVGLWFNMRYYLQDDSYSQLQRQVYAVSYTHLTLPTTPYV